MLWDLGLVAVWGFGYGIPNISAIVFEVQDRADVSLTANRPYQRPKGILWRMVRPEEGDNTHNA